MKYALDSVIDNKIMGLINYQKGCALYEILRSFGKFAERM